MRRILVFLSAFLLFPSLLQGQEPTDTGSFQYLNNGRIHINMTGMKVLGAWGAANLVGGAAGYLATDNKEWQSFHAMNALWGLVNAGIAAAGYMGARKEAQLDYTGSEALHRYEATKRLFLINAGLDVAYIGTGIYLAEHARVSGDPEVWRGFGNSLILQGAGLLLFDGIMFTAHQQKDKRWYRLLKSVRVSGSGVGLCYTF